MSMIRPARLRGVRTNKSDCRFPAGRDDICEVVRRSQIYTCKLATCKFWDKCKSSVSSFTENIFENSRKCFSLCWVLVRSRNFRDVEQRRRLCKTRVFFWILQWEWDFGDGKWGLQMKRARKWDWYPRPPPPSLRTLLFQRHPPILEDPLISKMTPRVFRNPQFWFIRSWIPLLSIWLRFFAPRTECAVVLVLDTKQSTVTPRSPCSSFVFRFQLGPRENLIILVRSLFKLL